MTKQHVFRLFYILPFLIAAVVVFKLTETRPATIQLSSFAADHRELQSAELNSIFRIQNTPHARVLPVRFKDNPAFQLFIKLEAWL